MSAPISIADVRSLVHRCLASQKFRASQCGAAATLTDELLPFFEKQEKCSVVIEAELGQWLVNVAGTMLRKLLIGLH